MAVGESYGMRVPDDVQYAAICSSAPLILDRRQDKRSVARRLDGTAGISRPKTAKT